MPDPCTHEGLLDGLLEIPQGDIRFWVELEAPRNQRNMEKPQAQSSWAELQDESIAVELSEGLNLLATVALPLAMCQLYSQLPAAQACSAAVLVKIRATFASGLF